MTFFIRRYALILLVILSIVLALAIPFSCLSQNNNLPQYHLNTKRELTLFSSSFTGLGLAHFLRLQKPILTEDKINNLGHPDFLFGFDTYSTKQNNKTARRNSDYGLHFSIVAPTLLLLSPIARKNIKPMAIILVETGLTTSALTTLTKETVRRKRPYVFNPEVSLANKTKRDATSSFFSGHTSFTTAMCFPSASMYAKYHPKSKAKYFVWATAAAIPALVGYWRIKGGRHYTTDVVVGYIIGASVGILIPEIHTKKK